MALSTTLTSGGETTTASELYKIKQGDACVLPVEILLNDTPLTDDDLPLMDEIEFMLGRCVRRLVRAEDAWSEALEKWKFELLQADTLKLRPGVYDIDVRVQFYGGSTLGMKNRQKVRILPSMSRRVII